MNFDLKNFLKKIKLNEENISMVLGALVIVIVGFLIVNYFKDKKSQTLPEALSTTNQTQSGNKTHKVAKGDTLWAISENAYGSGYNWVDIKKANNLKSDFIEVGQELNLPEISAKQPTATKPVATIDQGTQSITGASYTVAHGDTLWKVAVRAYGDGYKWVEIAKANKLVNPNTIHTGNVLTLPR